MASSRVANRKAVKMQITQLLSKWSFIRTLRLGLGLLAGYNGIIEHDYLLLAIGAVLIFQAFTNTGCSFGSNSSCAVPPPSKKVDK